MTKNYEYANMFRHDKHRFHKELKSTFMTFWPITLKGLGHLSLTFSSAALGAWLFHWLNLPLPFMLGPLTATLLISFTGFMPRVPVEFFLSMLTILGLYAGSILDQEVLAGVLKWPISLTAMFILVGVTVYVNTHYFNRFAGLDKLTAFFASVPGAQTMALLLSVQIGADDRKVLIPQITRVLAVIYFVPVVLVASQDWMGIEIDRVRGTPNDPWIMPEWHVILLVLAAILVGYLIAKKLKWPQPTLLGTLCAVGLLQVTGVTQLDVPGQALVPVQFVLGTFLGARFARVEWGSAFKLSLHGFVALTITVILMFLMTVILVLFTDLPPAALLLAFAPAGLPEMVLIAATLKIDPAFVVFHQLTRFLIIALAMPIIARRLAINLKKEAQSNL